MGTWWIKNVTEWLELPAYLYDMCALYSPRGDEIAQVVCALYQGQ